MPKREREIQHEILLAVGRLPFARCWRANVGTFRYLRSEGVIHIGIPGMADVSGILACGRRLEIEVKSASGRLRKDQKRWRDMILCMGGLWILGRSVESVIDQLDIHREDCETCQEGVSFFSGNESGGG